MIIVLHQIHIIDAELPAALQHEEEPVYEVMMYGRSSQSQTSVSNPDKIDSRPPQPAPKPKPSRGEISAIYRDGIINYYNMHDIL